ncbi:type II toxin-antitoxin system VapC family toxin [Fibrella forsythiae]|uniref:Type II toxin-antitoxin system VapC family toxin n=1 Tax=Fibrella forsythiae TaxID=2817061 RepID=A0ABS3JP23_9BACT|nr:type II toxin-antitoxin system VapC family toxin [Fibrella forsythiae]MBO0951759.1 type II toxin-antitoxin system VapC family toxin [Fibrella forsythiae]
MYSAKPDYAFLRSLILAPDSYVSLITKLEVLGFRNLSVDDKSYLESIFSTIAVLAIDDDLAELAIDLRQAKKMLVGDAFIAAIALLNGLDLYTNNTQDFDHISNLTLINPLG